MEEKGKIEENTTPKKPEPINRDIPPYNWLKEVKIYNHKYERVPNTWFEDRGVDAIVLYFSMRNADRDNIMYEFYEMYENARFVNLPIEVINIPMDDTKEDMWQSFEEQANWFTLRFNNPVIPTLQYRYGITAVPHLLVMRLDGTIVSTHGILDLDIYGMNALVSWLSTAAGTDRPKRMSKDLSMYGTSWKYLSCGIGKTSKPSYRRKFSEVAEGTMTEPSISDGIPMRIAEELKSRIMAED